MNEERRELNALDRRIAYEFGDNVEERALSEELGKSECRCCTSRDGGHNLGKTLKEDMLHISCIVKGCDTRVVLV